MERGKQKNALFRKMLIKLDLKLSGEILKPL